MGRPTRVRLAKTDGYEPLRIDLGGLEIFSPHGALMQMRALALNANARVAYLARFTDVSWVRSGDPADSPRFVRSVRRMARWLHGLPLLEMRVVPRQPIIVHDKRNADILKEIEDKHADTPQLMCTEFGCHVTYDLAICLGEWARARCPWSFWAIADEPTSPFGFEAGVWHPCGANRNGRAQRSLYPVVRVAGVRIAHTRAPISTFSQSFLTMLESWEEAISVAITPADEKYRVDIMRHMAKL